MAKLKPVRYKELGPLHDLLLEGCGQRSIPNLANALGISHQYIYRWIATERVPPNMLDALVDISGGKLSKVDLLPFIR